MVGSKGHIQEVSQMCEHLGRILSDEETSERWEWGEAFQERGQPRPRSEAGAPGLCRALRAVLWDQSQGSGGGGAGVPGW